MKPNIIPINSGNVKTCFSLYSSYVSMNISKDKNTVVNILHTLEIIYKSQIE